MAAIVNPYDNLYTNLKNKFTVVNNGSEYTLGDFMLMKAGKKSEKNELVAVKANDTHTMTTVINFMNDKLTAKSPAIKERTLKRFPLRTSFSAVLSAVAAAALVFSCGIFSLIGRSNTTAYTADTVIVEEEIETNDDNLGFSVTNNG